MTPPPKWPPQNPENPSVAVAQPMPQAPRESAAHTIYML